MKKIRQKAFTLIEVLIFTSILALFFVTAAAVVTATLRNIKINEHRILATRYGEELLELVRSEKEKDWYSFSTNYSTDAPGSSTYCFNSPLGNDWSSSSPISGACSTTGLSPAIFKREITLSSQNIGSQVSVTVVVKWDEFGTSQNVTFKTVMTVYEN